MALQAKNPILAALAALALSFFFPGAILAGPPCAGAASQAAPPPCMDAAAPAGPPCLGGSPQAGAAQMAHGRVLGESLLAAFAAQADVRLEATLQNLRTLALTSEVRSGKWESMQRLIAGFQARNPHLLVFYIHPDGSYCTAERGLTGESLSDRSYFPGLMAGNEVAGAIVVGKTSGKKSFITGVPIVEQGRVTGAVGAALYAEDLAAAMEKSMPLPRSIVIVATDKDKALALCSGKDSGGKPCLEPCRATTGQASGFSLTSSLTGWRFSITGPECPQ